MRLTHLYNSLCLSVVPSDPPSVHRSVTLSKNDRNIRNIINIVLGITIILIILILIIIIIIIIIVIVIIIVVVVVMSSLSSSLSSKLSSSSNCQPRQIVNLVKSSTSSYCKPCQIVNLVKSTNSTIKLLHCNLALLVLSLFLVLSVHLFLFFLICHLQFAIWQGHLWSTGCRRELICIMQFFQNVSLFCYLQLMGGDHNLNSFKMV